MKKHKYIRMENGFIIFPETFNHSDFGNKENVISAGFCYINTGEEICKCFGESVSLGIKSKEDDSDEMRIQFFGYFYT